MENKHHGIPEKTFSYVFSHQTQQMRVGYGKSRLPSCPQSPAVTGVAQITSEQMTVRSGMMAKEATVELC